MATLAPSLRALFDEVNRLAPKRSKASDGWIGDPAHSARRSDHNPGSRGLVHAADITHDPGDGVDCNDLADRIKDDPRVSYVIWNRRIYNPATSNTWRRYSGSNPHDKHVHVSIKSTVAAEKDTSPWLGQVAAAGPAPRVLGEEDEVPLVDVLADPRAAGSQGGWALMADGTVHRYRGARNFGEPKGQDYWEGRQAVRFDPLPEGYVVVSSAGETYYYRDELPG